MLKIGFWDAYLDNWHANYYPGFLREAIAQFGFDAAVTDAYAFYDLPGGTTTADWCAQRDIRRHTDPAAFLDAVDAIMVIGADDARLHNEIAVLPLQSGKPTFVDKTFAADTASGKRLFALAEQHHTPVLSTSAQRYCPSITAYLESHPKPRFVSTVGPHSLDNYAVHQFEPIVALMGIGAQRVKAFSAGDNVTQMMIDWGGGRMASFLQSPNPWAEFNFMVSDGTNGARLASEDFYIPTMKAILDFFVTGISPVPAEETLEVLALIDAVRAARNVPDTWLSMHDFR
ncbi:MAG: hypothetical protein E7604_06475 [Ruminococcaceae bacterium]|nr:hypothetical protein [Oscillospiraceae bacterium]